MKAKDFKRPHYPKNEDASFDFQLCFAPWRFLPRITLDVRHSILFVPGEVISEVCGKYSWASMDDWSTVDGRAVGLCFGR